MALARGVKETILDREMRDDIKATVGFEQLGADCDALVLHTNE